MAATMYEHTVVLFTMVLSVTHSVLTACGAVHNVGTWQLECKVMNTVLHSLERWQRNDSVTTRLPPSRVVKDSYSTEQQ